MCWQERDGAAARLWRTEQLSDVRVLATFRDYAEPSPEETAVLAAEAGQVYPRPLGRGGGYVVVLREGRSVAMVVLASEGAGSYVAGSEGDSRPGAGAFPGMPAGDHRQEVDGKLALAERDAAQLVQAVVRHLGWTTARGGRGDAAAPAPRAQPDRWISR